MNTINAMKHIKECLETANTMGDITDTLWAGDAETLFDYIDAAIAREEAQTVEPVGIVQKSAIFDGNTIIQYEGVDHLLTIGTELFTRPAAPTSGERAVLITELRKYADEWESVEEAGIQAQVYFAKAADMLAADAQELEHTRKMYEQAVKGRSDFRQALRETRAAHQVAVPQGFDPVYVSRLIEALYENSDPVSIDAAEEFERMITAAPQSPQADAPPQRQPMTNERLQFLSGEYADLPDEGPAFRDGFRAAENYHGIGEKP